MSTIAWFSVVLAFALTLVFIFLFQPIASKIGLVDIPGGRKRHEGNIPIVGGVAMGLAFCFAALTLNLSLLPYRALFAGGVLLVIAGVIDDFHELSAKMRLLVELIVSVLMIFWGGVFLAKFGNFFFTAPMALGDFGIVLTILAVISLINAKNMLDGVDGLAAGISVIELGFLAYLAMQVQRWQDAHLIILMMASLLAFLCFNFPKSLFPKTFMGDAGSMFLGFFLTWFCVSLSQGQVAANPVTFVWIMALPLFDFLGVLIVRILKKRSPFKADRSHIHHRLLSLGCSPLQVNLILYSASLLCGLIGVMAAHFNILGEYMLLPFLFLFAGYVVWIALPQTGEEIS